MICLAQGFRLNGKENERNFLDNLCYVYFDDRDLLDIQERVDAERKYRQHGDDASHYQLSREASEEFHPVRSRSQPAPAYNYAIDNLKLSFS